MSLRPKARWQPCSLIGARVKDIFNFASIQLQVPEGMAVEDVDFTVKLDNLAANLAMAEGWIFETIIYGHLS